MKALKLATISLAFAFCSTYVAAEAPNMQLTLTGGTILNCDVSDISEMKLEIKPEAIIEIEGHQCVDLGLPSGTLWATCNVGSAVPSGYGDYFSWGEISVKDIYEYSYTQWAGYGEEYLMENGVIDADGNLTSQYDVATVKWGKAWSMPTLEQIEELISNCIFSWCTYEGHLGCKVYGPNGNFIFLPASGHRIDSEFERTIYTGQYWSATVSSGAYLANSLLFDDRIKIKDTESRTYGMPVRPIAVTTSSEHSVEDVEYLIISHNNDDSSLYNTEEIINISFPTEEISFSEPEVVDGHDCVDLGLRSGLLWATCNLGADSPEKFGNYYAWGEQALKDIYDINKGKWSTYTFEQLKSEDVIHPWGVLTASYDMATQAWGETWRMPTVDEYEELASSCTWEWINKYPYIGVKVTGPNGNSIFLPAAGNYHAYQYETGSYWTSDASYGDDGSYIFYFDSENRFCLKDLRGLGVPVRAVHDPSGDAEPQ